MAVKKKARKKAVRKMLKRMRSSSDLEKLAKVKMPKWRVVEETAQDSPNVRQVDAISPKLSDLRSKKNSAGLKSRVIVDSEGASDSGSKENKKGVTGLVNMAPESGDASVGVKTQVFEDDEHTASQG